MLPPISMLLRLPEPAGHTLSPLWTCLPDFMRPATFPVTFSSVGTLTQTSTVTSDVMEGYRLQATAFQPHTGSSHRPPPEHYDRPTSNIGSVVNEECPLGETRHLVGMAIQKRKKQRVHSKSACISCKTSHIACNDAQPCSNCIRRGGRCERAHSKPVLASHSPSHLPKTRRKNVKAACACCNKSHLACDDYRPCKNCVRLGLSAQCQSGAKVVKQEVARYPWSPVIGETTASIVEQSDKDQSDASTEAASPSNDE